MSQTGEAFLSERVDRSGFTIFELPESPTRVHFQGRRVRLTITLRADWNDFSSIKQGVNLPDSA
jgi:hypothetical protein